VYPSKKFERLGISASNLLKSKDSSKFLQVEWKRHWADEKAVGAGLSVAKYNHERPVISRHGQFFGFEFHNIRWPKSQKFGRRPVRMACTHSVLADLV
jgi:hypothetical protein